MAAVSRGLAQEEAGGRESGLAWRELAELCVALLGVLRQVGEVRGCLAESAEKEKLRHAELTISKW